MLHLFFISLSMKNVIILILISLFTYQVKAQESSENKLTRKEKKEIKKKEDNENLKNLYALIESRIWVIRANDVRAINGSSVDVSPDMNFVYVTHTKGVIQLAFQELIGLGENNIGGMTVEGEITRYNVEEFRDNQQIEYSIQVNNINGGFVILNISVMSNARTTVNVSTHDGVNFTFSGYIETQGGQPIIKGSSAK